MSARNSLIKVAVVALTLTNVALLSWIVLTHATPPAQSDSQAAEGGPRAATAASLGGAGPSQPTAAAQEAASLVESPAGTVQPEISAAPIIESELLTAEAHTIRLFERAAPSVAYITTRARGARRGYPSSGPSGAGSGFVWDAEGHIVTNFHVIAEASEATVTLSDGTEWPARLVGAAPDADLAVLKIHVPSEKLAPIAVGQSKSLKVGQFVIAIGNPFGLDQTLTTGVISALDREMESISGRKIYGVVQTDAAINPGNSGGPLIDSQGRLIGVNTAIRSPSGSSAGIGFAVPVDTVSRVVPQLIAHGRVARPGLGVFLANAEMARRLGTHGAVVRGVQPGSPAANAGLDGLRMERSGSARLGDVIVTVDGSEIREPNDLLKALDSKEVGDDIVLGVSREGTVREVRIKLAALE